MPLVYHKKSQSNQPFAIFYLPTLPIFPKRGHILMFIILIAMEHTKLYKIPDGNQSDHL